MLKYKNTLEPFANGFLSAETEPIEYRIAYGMFERARTVPITLHPNQFFAGIHDRTEYCAVYFNFGSGVVVDHNKFQKQIETHPEFADELTEMLHEIKDWDSREIVHKTVTEHERDLDQSYVCWGGGLRNWVCGHGNPDFGLIVREGTDGVRAQIEKYRTTNVGKESFYDALLLTLDALDLLAQRYKALATEMANQTDGESRVRLLRMVKALDKVPKHGADDFFEACQAFWLTFCFDGIDSPGRFDQYMIDFYRRSEPTDRLLCLENLWQLFYSTRSWNLCISGSDEQWNDQTNELSYDILACARKFGYNTPNITMRVHRNTPEALWRSAAETIGTGIGMPALYNDECVCPALEAIGIPAADAHEYCMNGCNQIDIFGKSHMGLEDGEVCLAKCLELVLTNGVCSKTGKTVGLKTGTPEMFDTYDALFDAYKKQVECAADASMALANRTQKICADYVPNPYRSNLVKGCIEKGLDYKNRGPLYGHAQILAEGLADAVDSLAVLKYFVYDTKKYSLSDVTDALQKNYNGYDEMYYDFCSFEKFGNDSLYTDEVYKAVTDHFYGYLLKFPTFRGGVFGGGCSTFQRASQFGEAIGALPNGKKSDSSLLADSIGAVPGCDKKGPTALLKSVLHADQVLAKSGNVLQLKFSKSVFRTEDGLQAFIQLAKTYFAEKGQQLSVNVLSREELLDAQKHPEAHQNLIVRVGGYSDYFTKLSVGLQNNVIQRTELF